MERKAKVAWYDPGGNNWIRDIWVLTHPWYTLWHLAYVVIGASLAETMNWATLGWTLFAFFLAMGVGAHCLDEWKGRPLNTQIPGIYLWLASLLSVSGAALIGIIVGMNETFWVLPCIIFGSSMVFAYNLELFRGSFHNDLWFAAAWGAFPVITAYVAQTHSISWSAAVIALACLFYSLAQRVLSKQVRFWRRKVSNFEGSYVDEDYVTRNRGESVWFDSPRKLIGKNDIIGAPERALKIMTWAVIVAAVGLIV